MGVLDLYRSGLPSEKERGCLQRASRVYVRYEEMVSMKESTSQQQGSRNKTGNLQLQVTEGNKNFTG